MTKATLYQFPVSHFCEKARWALDLAGVEYEVRNLAFGEHAFVVPRLASGKRTVPVFVREGAVLTDSNEILALASRTFSLFPDDASQRAEVDELVTLFDRELGPSVRVFAYSHVLPSLRVFRTVAFRHLDPLRRILSSAAAPLLRPLMRRQFGIPRKTERAKERLLEVADRIDRKLGDGHYLVGGRFTAADLTGAALLGPLLALRGTPWHPSPLSDGPIADMRELLMARPVGRWATRIYEKHRGPTPFA